MSPRSKINQSSPSETNLRGGSESPTQPGAYWFQRDTMSREITVDVRVTNGQLTVWWPNDDQPVANLRGHWRGPIPPSTGPGSHKQP